MGRLLETNYALISADLMNTLQQRSNLTAIWKNKIEDQKVEFLYIYQQQNEVNWIQINYTHMNLISMINLF